LQIPLEIHCTQDGFKKYRGLFVYISNEVNALKFYYGAMLKRKFLYEIKRPRKGRYTLLSEKAL